MSLEDNKMAARRFVEEALDGGSFEALCELFVPGAIRHFPPGDIRVDPMQSAVAPDRSMHTDIHHLYGEGDYVAIHLTHHVAFAPGARFRHTRLRQISTRGAAAALTQDARRTVIGSLRGV